jgi:hypothetical protein
LKRDAAILVDRKGPGRTGGEKPKTSDGAAVADPRCSAVRSNSCHATHSHLDRSMASTASAATRSTESPPVPKGVVRPNAVD